jgi:hypothetical protein
MPVAGVKIKEGPFQKGQVDRANVWIVQNVFTVVPFRYETIPKRGQINRKRDDGNETREEVFNVPLLLHHDLHVAAPETLCSHIRS